MSIRRALGSCGSLLFAFPIVATWHCASIPLSLKLLSLTFLVVAAARPDYGLVMVALALPLTAYIGLKTTAVLSSTSVAELMIAPFLLAAGLRLSLGSSHTPSRLARPATVLAVVIAAGVVLGLSIEQQQTAWPAEFFAKLWQTLTRDYFVDRVADGALHTGAIWIEGLVLGVVTERLVRQHQKIASLLVSALLIGTALGALCTWDRVVDVALRRPDPWWYALTAFRTLRYNELYADINAAGSVYALFLVPMIWLAVTRKRHWYWLLVAAVLPVFWLTGSRAAMAAAVVAMALLWGLTARRSHALVIAGAALTMVLIAGVVLWNPGRIAQSGAGISIDVRWQLMKVGFEMAKQHPIFGVGLGQFQLNSRAFITPDLVAMFPPASVGENAHNNFIQVLAELGVVGFAAFAWLLGAAAVAITGTVRRPTPDAVVAGFAGGMVAFLLTCLVGHPLLTTEILWMFLLVLGLTTGLAPARSASLQAARWHTWFSASLMILAIGSVPFRWRQLQHNADLDHVFIGATRVVGAVDGISYQLAGPRSTWFVRANVRALEISLRVTPDSPPSCLAHVDVDGRHANDTEVIPIAWTQVVFPFTPSPGDPVSRRIDLRVDNGACHLMVGAFKLRD